MCQYSHVVGSVAVMLLAVLRAPHPVAAWRVLAPFCGRSRGNEWREPQRTVPSSAEPKPLHFL